MGLPEQHHARLAQPPDRRAVPRGDIVLQVPGSDHGRHAFDGEVFLDRVGYALQGAPVLSPGEGGLGRFGFLERAFGRHGGEGMQLGVGARDAIQVCARATSLGLRSPER